MLAKIQKSYCMFLVILDAIGIILNRMMQRLCELVSTKTLKNKLHAIMLISCTIPILLIERDATATVFVGIIAVPMFFTKESWVD